MKCLKTWKRLISVLLLGLVVAGCASANGKADSKKPGEAAPPAAKSVMKAKGTEPVVLKEKGMWRIKLNSGYDMPVLGLGTWSQNNRTAEESVYVALKNGYRLIDTARYYGNEKGVGEGVRRAIADGIVKREEVFITSKIMPTDYHNYADRLS